ncbi:MAG: hydroxymethylglutaryl-CoA lyase [Candidatus Nucleicultricaceae bacterium]
MNKEKNNGGSFLFLMRCLWVITVFLSLFAESSYASLLLRELTQKTSQFARTMRFTSSLGSIHPSIIKAEEIEDFEQFVLTREKRPLPKKATIVEVGPRDGLQNEETVLTPQQISDFIKKLERANIRIIESGALVSKKAVPAMAGTVEVLQNLDHTPNHTYPVLIPSLDALIQARDLGVKDIAVFTSPSDHFNEKNIRKSTKESLRVIREIVQRAKSEETPLRVRGYVSCVLGCPYEGVMTPERVGSVSLELLDMGCDEISLGDTIGVGTPESTEDLLCHLFDHMHLEKSRFGVHFHDTGKRALKNILVALEHDITTIDSSVGGIGGCPFARAAAAHASKDGTKRTAGNVATEKVVWMLNHLGVESNIDWHALLEARTYILEALLRNPIHDN